MLMAEIELTNIWFPVSWNPSRL